jgi:sugar phosphate isomerase/epimerase
MNNSIGVMAGLDPDRPCFAAVADFGLDVCQPCSWNPDHWTAALAQRLRDEAKERRVRLNALWAGWPGPAEWNFRTGPTTLGLIPAAHRAVRVAALKRAGEFAKALGVPAVITHLGFIPEQPADPVFGEVVASVRDIALHLQRLGLGFWFETGQETPVTMLRLIQAVALPNLGVNLDPANLILYGKGSPVDALDVFGAHVRSVHAKDGLYPTDPLELGREVRIGEGRVRFPELVCRLQEVGFRGDFIIEREIAGEEQRRDISTAIGYLRDLLAKH